MELVEVWKGMKYDPNTWELHVEWIETPIKMEEASEAARKWAEEYIEILEWWEK